jgi:hypothetical protein
LTHTVQQANAGGEQFVAAYVNDFLDQYNKQLVAGSKTPGDSAYFGISYEVQAYAIENAVNTVLSNAKYLQMFNEVCGKCVSKYSFDAGLGYHGHDAGVVELRKVFRVEYEKERAAWEKKHRL